MNKSTKKLLILSFVLLFVNYSKADSISDFRKSALEWWKNAKATAGAKMEELKAELGEQYKDFKQNAKKEPSVVKATVARTICSVKKPELKGKTEEILCKLACTVPGTVTAAYPFIGSEGQTAIARTCICHCENADRIKALSGYL